MYWIIYKIGKNPQVLQFEVKTWQNWLRKKYETPRSSHGMSSGGNTHPTPPPLPGWGLGTNPPLLEVCLLPSPNEHSNPARLPRILDTGGAGGRNTIWLYSYYYQLAYAKNNVSCILYPLYPSITPKLQRTGIRLPGGRVNCWHDVASQPPPPPIRKPAGHQQEPIRSHHW